MLLLLLGVGDEIPSRLPDGAYKFECWGYNVQIPEGKTEIQRTDSSSNGSALVITQNGTTLVKETSTSNWNGTSTSDVTTMTSTYEKLSDGSFKQTTDVVAKSTVDGESYDDTQHYYRIFRTTDRGFEYNVLVKNGDEAEKPGIGESFVQVMPDGRIVILDYVREKYKRERKDRGNGAYSPGAEVFQSAGTCIYTPAK